MTFAAWGRSVVAAAILVGASLPARAAEACTIFTWSSVAFGTYNVFSATPLDSTGSLLIACNAEARDVTVDLSRGNAPTFSPRYMINGASHLNYNLFLDAARTTIWGDGTAGTLHYSQTDPPGLFLLTIYGRVPALQDLPAGSYSDTITATINF